MPFFLKPCFKLRRRKNKRKQKADKSVKSFSDVTAPVTTGEIWRDCRSSSSTSNVSGNAERTAGKDFSRSKTTPPLSYSESDAISDNETITDEVDEKDNHDTLTVTSDGTAENDSKNGSVREIMKGSDMDNLTKQATPILNGEQVNDIESKDDRVSNRNSGDPDALCEKDDATQTNEGKYSEFLSDIKVNCNVFEKIEELKRLRSSISHENQYSSIKIVKNKETNIADKVTGLFSKDGDTLNHADLKENKVNEDYLIDEFIESGCHSLGEPRNNLGDKKNESEIEIFSRKNEEMTDVKTDMHNKSNISIETIGEKYLAESNSPGKSEKIDRTHVNFKPMATSACTIVKDKNDANVSITKHYDKRQEINLSEGSSSKSTQNLVESKCDVYTSIADGNIVNPDYESISSPNSQQLNSTRKNFEENIYLKDIQKLHSVSCESRESKPTENELNLGNQKAVLPNYYDACIAKCDCEINEKFLKKDVENPLTDANWNTRFTFQSLEKERPFQTNENDSSIVSQKVNSIDNSVGISNEINILTDLDEGKHFNKIFKMSESSTLTSEETQNGRLSFLTKSSKENQTTIPNSTFKNRIKFNNTFDDSETKHYSYKSHKKGCQSNKESLEKSENISLDEYGKTFAERESDVDMHTYEHALKHNSNDNSNAIVNTCEEYLKNLHQNSDLIYFNEDYGLNKTAKCKTQIDNQLECYDKNNHSIEEAVKAHNFATGNFVDNNISKFHVNNTDTCQFLYNSESFNEVNKERSCNDFEDESLDIWERQFASDDIWRNKSFHDYSSVSSSSESTGSSKFSESGDAKEGDINARESESFIISACGDNTNDEKVAERNKSYKSVQEANGKAKSRVIKANVQINGNKHNTKLNEQMLTINIFQRQSNKGKETIPVTTNIIERNYPALAQGNSFNMENRGHCVKKNSPLLQNKIATRNGHLETINGNSTFADSNEFKTRRRESIEIFNKKKRQALSDMKPNARVIPIKISESFEINSCNIENICMRQRKRSPLSLRSHHTEIDKNLVEFMPLTLLGGNKSTETKQALHRDTNGEEPLKDAYGNIVFTSESETESSSHTSEQMPPALKRILDASRAIRSPKYSFGITRKAHLCNVQHHKKPVVKKSPKLNLVAYITKDDKKLYQIRKDYRKYNRDSANFKMLSPEKINYRPTDFTKHQISNRATSPNDLKSIFDDTFRRYAGKGRTNGELISYKRSSEWLRDAGIIGNTLTVEEANDAFKCTAGVKIALNKGDYRFYLKKLARLKRLNYNEMYERLCSPVKN